MEAAGLICSDPHLIADVTRAPSTHRGWRHFKYCVITTQRYGSGSTIARREDTQELYMRTPMAVPMRQAVSSTARPHVKPVRSTFQARGRWRSRARPWRGSYTPGGCDMQKISTAQQWHRLEKLALHKDGSERRCALGVLIERVAAARAGLEGIGRDMGRHR
ncbi:hypothetical protein CALCODRAFT_10110 [Calocera cornea HHB12733]|uniref:Uncharacterized protein n=1 Tax=Calocera cornea HHB12733 TaxID=1353952 RepID=A0A165J6F0_9BASI|nr:hypothetical protein CALCODRAFT_10110 [Calocera cornea HHB12733]